LPVPKHLLKTGKNGLGGPLSTVCIPGRKLSSARLEEGSGFPGPDRVTSALGAQRKVQPWTLENVWGVLEVSGRRFLVRE